MKQKRSCRNCIRGTAITVNNDILCKDKGAVSPDYVCSKHRFIPEPKSYKEMNLKCIDCENFIVSGSAAKGARALGLCQLFSVRQFDGKEKNACSKFVKKTVSEVS